MIIETSHQRIQKKKKKKKKRSQEEAAMRHQAQVDDGHVVCSSCVVNWPVRMCAHSLKQACQMHTKGREMQSTQKQQHDCKDTYTHTKS